MVNDQEQLKTLTFGEWLSLWFDTYKKPNLKPNSLRNIEQMIRLHTPSWLKDVPLANLELFQIDKALSSIPASRTQVYTRQVWNNALKRADTLGIIPKNLIPSTEKIRYKKKRGNALTQVEQTEFIQRLDGQRVKWLMLFYMHSGVRRSEAVNLEWTDINFQENLILIKGTKTNDSYRQILLTKELRQIIEEQRKQTQKDINTAFESKHPEKVFDYSANYMSQIFKKICPKHTLHDLRHTYITRCAECGMNINVCQQLVGHSTPQLTMQIYTHVFDNFKRKEALKFTLFPDVN